MRWKAKKKIHFQNIHLNIVWAPAQMLNGNIFAFEMIFTRISHTRDTQMKCTSQWYTDRQTDRQTDMRRTDEGLERVKEQADRKYIVYIFICWVNVPRQGQVMKIFIIRRYYFVALCSIWCSLTFINNFFFTENLRCISIYNAIIMVS